MAKWILLKKGWSYGSHHTQPPHYQNGLSPKNVGSNHHYCLTVSAAFKYVSQPTATTFASSSSVFILLLWLKLLHVCTWNSFFFFRMPGELATAAAWFGLGPGAPLTSPTHVVEAEVAGVGVGALGDLYALPFGSSLKEKYPIFS